MTRSRCDPQQDGELSGKDPQIEDLDGSFSYSQKFFHISDGNLYSVFSPLQGRSYGVKPSFLRRQRCTVQQSKGKGHKNSRKSLKFHNFIPSESVISEREDSHELWKVHGECRLREEHGTKQIMVTNWSHSAACPPSASDGPLEESDKSESSMAPVDPANPPDLFDVRNNLEMLQSLEEETLESLEEWPENQASRKHRRKPVVTKRVVPYSQYLSMIDGTSNECPLDLTCNSKPPTENPNFDDTDEDTHSCNGSLQNEIDIKPQNICDASLENQPSVVFLGPMKPLPNYAVPEESSENVSMQYPGCSTLQSLLIGQPPSYAQYQQSCSSSTKIPVQKTSREDGPKLPKVPRKPSHRTIIRKKLEDTFKQNGFLVKTKQVSDGDATFCKFKQLRKYTRYYLKSWHQHLPEEVHKLWKGFLPPKSNLGSGKKDT